MAKGKRPDFKIVATKREENAEGKRHFAQVGVAWQSPNGKRGITLTLNPGTVLDWRMTREFYVTLFPFDDEHESDIKGSDEIPF